MIADDERIPPPLDPQPQPDPVQPEPVVRTLGEVQADLCRRLDTDAESVRLRYITAGCGQDMVYREKFDQAVAVNTAGEDAANALSDVDMMSAYPTLAASVGIEAPTLWACADLVLQRYASWAQISYAIERARLAGKSSIRTASDIAAANAAYDAVTWPT